MKGFINFVKKDGYYTVMAKRGNGKLGKIEYYRPWRKWIFWSFDSDCIYDAECLRDIAKFMEGLE